MFILIPPSEGKNPTDDEQKFSLDNISFSSLNTKRSKLIDYLCENDLSIENYSSIFNISSRNYEKINAINSNIKYSRVLSTIDRYTGVLYDYLDYSNLDEIVKFNFNNSVIIFSGLFGLLRPEDKIPNYKLKMGTKLIDNEKLSRYWNDDITRVLKNLLNDQIVCNFLPNEFMLAFDNKKITPRHELNFTFLQENKQGELKSVTHWTKALRGSLIRYLLMQVNNLDSINELTSISKSFTNKSQYEFSKNLSKITKTKSEIVYIKKKDA